VVIIVVYQKMNVRFAKHLVIVVMAYALWMEHVRPAERDITLNILNRLAIATITERFVFLGLH
jgi:hypothetical protein